jgi:biopolymer transport protein ExbB
MGSALFMVAHALEAAPAPAPEAAAPAAPAPAPAAPAAAAPEAPRLELAPEAAKAATDMRSNMGFWRVVVGSGFWGILDWIGLFGTLLALVWFTVDCFITVRTKKIIPQQLVNRVSEAMEQGDVLKALKSCEDEPGPMANILAAGFTHVEEGFDTIQEAVGVAADLESEKLMQRINYLNITSNIAPMLGLLGTVQGMIWAFATLATAEGGAIQTSLLALNIAQALYTTAAGLGVAIPCVSFYYVFRNTANKLILRMEAITLELIKGLRNVEVVTE